MQPTHSRSSVGKEQYADVFRTFLVLLAVSLLPRWPTNANVHAFIFAELLVEGG
jgi:hypothetical protein